MTRTLAALALALSASPALAQDYNRQELVRGLCQKDGCDEFTILATDRIRATDEGTLFKTRLKTFHASYAGRQDRGEENGYSRSAMARRQADPRFTTSPGWPSATATGWRWPIPSSCR